MTKLRIVWAAALAGIMPSFIACSSETPPTNAADFSHGAILAAACSGCHAPTNQAVPTLAGLDQYDMRDRMFAYANDPQGNTVMHRLARGYSEEDINAIAAHFEATTK